MNLLPSHPLYGVIEDSISRREKMIIVVEMGELPQMSLNFMEFLIVDNRSAYHEVLERLALKDLGAFT